MTADDGRDGERGAYHKNVRYHDTEFTNLTTFSSGMVFKSQKLDPETSFNFICQDQQFVELSQQFVACFLKQTFV